MYNSELIAQRIKKIAKQQNISIRQLLANCELNKNTIINLTKGTDISMYNFAKIADELNCSIDYLLGRPNNSNLYNSSQNTFDDFNKLSPDLQEIVLQHIRNLTKLQVNRKEIS